MLPHLENTEMRALLRKLHFGMAKHQDLALINRRLWQMLSRLNKMQAIRKYPRVSLSSAGNHHRVAAGLPHHPDRILSRIHIPVSNDRYTDRLFDSADNVPIRASRIILLAGPSVDRDRGRPGILKHLGGFHGVDFILIKTGSDLDCDRSRRDSTNSPDDRSCPLKIAHEGRALIVVHDLRHRTAHVDVQNIERFIDQLLGGDRHGLGVGSEQLH